MGYETHFSDSPITELCLTAVEEAIFTKDQKVILESSNVSFYFLTPRQ